MRPSRFSPALTSMLAAAALFAAPPAFAQDNASENASIIFVAGTGGAAYPAAPVSTADKKDPAAELEALAVKLSDRTTQDGVAGIVEKMVGGLMQLPVGKFTAAIEDARPGTVKKQIPANATLADVAGPKAEIAPQQLGDQSRKAMGLMSGFAKAFAVMLPEFEALGKQMEEEFKAIKRH